MVASAGDAASVDIFTASDSAWHPFDFKILHGKTPCVDVAVLVPSETKITAAETIPYDHNFAIGQEAYFLGFPFGLFTSFGKKSSRQLS